VTGSVITVDVAVGLRTVLIIKMASVIYTKPDQMNVDHDTHIRNINPICLGRTL